MNLSFDLEIFNKLDEYLNDGLLEYRDSVSRISHDLLYQAETVRDVIALANVARQRGKNTYLLFGVGEGVNESKGVIERRFYNLKEENLGSDQNLSVETYAKTTLSSLILEMISPVPKARFLCGEIKLPISSTPYMIGYLVIHPVATDQPYTLNKTFLDNNFLEGDCWVRNKKISRKLSSQEKMSLGHFRDIPFIGNQVWQTYLEQWPMTHAPLELHDENGKPLTEIVQNFIRQKQRILVIEGEVGSGKTTFLNQLRSDFAGIAKDNLQRDKFDHFPNDWIPCCFDLNTDLTDFGGNNGFLEILARSNFAAIKNHVVTIPSNQEHFITRTKFKFLLLIDALDEIRTDTNALKAILNSISNALQSSPDSKAVLTSRPGIVPNPWRAEQNANHYLIVKIGPLLREQIEEQLNKKIRLPEIALPFFRDNAEAYKYLETPLTLMPSIEYWRDLEESWDDDEMLSLLPEIFKEYAETAFEKFKIPPPNIGKLTHSVFLSLMKHEYEKGSDAYMDQIQADIESSLTNLAADLDGQEKETTRRRALSYFNPREHFERALNTGLLKQYQNQNNSLKMVSFRSEILQHYFAAMYLYQLAEEGEWQIVEQLSNTSFWSSNLELFQDLAFSPQKLNRLMKTLSSHPIPGVKEMISDSLARTKAYDNARAELKKILTKKFSDDDLDDLCFDLGIDPDDLPSIKRAKVRKLILTLEYRGRLKDLLMKVREERPEINMTGIWENLN